MDAGIVVGVAIGVGVQAVVFPVSWRLIGPRTPGSVLRHLRRSDNEYTTPVNSLGGAWNPAVPLSRNNPIFKSGTATYRKTDDGQVELRFTAKNGKTERHVGAIPEALQKGSPQRRRMHLIAAWAIGLYLAFAAGGLLLAYFLSAGSTGYRIGVGFAGAAAGFFLVWFTVLAVAAVKGARSSLHSGKTAQRRSHDAAVRS